MIADKGLSLRIPRKFLDDPPAMPMKKFFRSARGYRAAVTRDATPAP
jgi:hypothetical protein